MFGKIYYDKHIQKLWKKDLEYVKNKIIEENKTYKFDLTNSDAKLCSINMFFNYDLNPGRALFPFIMINPKFINTDQNIRRFLLGHEYGHVMGRHTLCLSITTCLGISLGILLTILSFFSSQSFITENWLSIYFTIVGSGMLIGSLDSDRNEYFADDRACDVIGIENAILAIETIGIQTGTQDSEKRKKRIERLKAIKR